jgi:hypothetical protein
MKNAFAPNSRLSLIARSRSCPTVSSSEEPCVGETFPHVAGQRSSTITVSTNGTTSSWRLPVRSVLGLHDLPFLQTLILALFDRICRHNGITHRLTHPASPNENGKVERFHGTFRPEFLDVAGPFTSVDQAQAAVDAWVADYNTNRPHQALDDKVPVTPSQRFAPVPAEQRGLVELWLPPGSCRLQPAD